MGDKIEGEKLPKKDVLEHKNDYEQFQDDVYKSFIGLDRNTLLRKSEIAVSPQLSTEELSKLKNKSAELDTLNKNSDLPDCCRGFKESGDFRDLVIKSFIGADIESRVLDCSCVTKSSNDTYPINICNEEMRMILMIKNVKEVKGTQGTDKKPNKETKNVSNDSDQFKNMVLESYVGKNAITATPSPDIDNHSFSKYVTEGVSKLGKNPTEEQLQSFIRNVSIYMKCQKLIKMDGLNLKDQQFRNLVIESFVGFDETCSPRDIEKVFVKFGILEEDDSDILDEFGTPEEDSSRSNIPPKK
ncbi:hypothetical protein L9F63_017949 [Diploptera punctata]|uniref:Uncharacterized protein n=1 Tax=Diploptera punctata TaxID=6984 RepID=A0AAD8EGI7_DIPPU|nr:hypothetical protein L9F63_017949 [Diploptera punctata]